jgi:hypothetical protein
MYSYNSSTINKLIYYIKSQNDINAKDMLADKVQAEFSLIKDRSVYYCDDFAIRFSYTKNKSGSLSNTVLSLSALQKYDAKPFFVCIVTPGDNYVHLANTTFLAKISHSSIDLRCDNIKGSFNGSDIYREIQGIINEPDNFKTLFEIHEGFTFEDNLIRLVYNTSNIVGTGKAYVPTTVGREIILNAPLRVSSFLASEDYIDLKKDLVDRTNENKSEILIASLIDNVNIRGRVIEFIITDNGSTLKQTIINALRNNSPIPVFKTEDKLGDFSKEYIDYDTETDIKTKVMYLGSNPKGYNIDKLLEFLSKKRSVYMVFLVGITEDDNLEMNLVSIFQDKILESTRIFNHWAGRNSRGVTQFDGHVLTEAIIEKSALVDIENAKHFLLDLLDAK